MYYQDLSPYRFNTVPTGIPGVFNVGWLSSYEPTPRGDVEPATMLKLAHLAETVACPTMGSHICDFCWKFRGNGEIWIAGNDGRVYASPVMLLHYIEKHNYLPPPSFLEAVHHATAALTECDCDAIIGAHLHKLETAPTFEDIPIPFYSAKVFWELSEFEDLTAFVKFVDRNFPCHISSYAVNDVGYFVRTKCEKPDELLRKVVAGIKRSKPKPFQCTAKLLYVGGEEQVYLNPIIKKPPTRRSSLWRWFSKRVSGSSLSA